MSQDIEYHQVEEAQQQDDEFKKLLAKKTSSLLLKRLQLPDTNITMYCDIPREVI